MAKKVENPEFPHHCVIYRVEGETSFSDGKKGIVYEGKCLKYGNSSLRSFKSEGVYKGDHGLDIPGLVDAAAGNLIDYEAFGRDHREGIMVTGVEHCGWGTTVYFNLPKN